jgi:caspase recruitment domain-containing protein 6
MTAFGGYCLYNFAPPAELREYPNLFAWLASSPIIVPFVLVTTVFFLGALCWLAVALVNLLAGSPFNYILVDRQGIGYRSFWGEKHFSWKELGPIRSLEFSIWQARGQQLRFWIAADTLGAEAARRGVEWWRWGGPSGAHLRIPATTYLGGGWLVGSLALATDSAASWLEELRQAAKIDRLEAEVADPPYNFRMPVELEAQADPSALDNAPLGDARPSDARPSDARPSDARPSDARPSDARPSDARPSDARPGVTRVGLPEPGTRSFGARRAPPAEGVAER